MASVECPHCGNVLSRDEEACGCGYVFPTRGSQLQGAKVARDVAGGIVERVRKKARIARALQSSKKASAGKPAIKVKATILDPAPDASRESKLMDCPACRARISKRAPRCPKCGEAPFAECQICAERIASNSRACPGCGDPDPFNP